LQSREGSRKRKTCRARSADFGQNLRYNHIPMQIEEAVAVEQGVTWRSPPNGWSNAQYACGPEVGASASCRAASIVMTEFLESARAREPRCAVGRCLAVKGGAAVPSALHSHRLRGLQWAHKWRGAAERGRVRQRVEPLWLSWLHKCVLLMQQDAPDPRGSRGWTAGRSARRTPRLCPRGASHPQDSPQGSPSLSSPAQHTV